MLDVEVISANYQRSLLCGMPGPGNKIHSRKDLN